FNVVTAVKQPGGHFQQLESDVDSQTHIGGEHNGNFLTGSLNGLLAFCGEAGSANDAFDAVADAGFQMLQGAFRAGKVDEAVGLRNSVEVVSDGNAGFLAEKAACILADTWGAGTV